MTLVQFFTGRSKIHVAKRIFYLHIEIRNANHEVSILQPIDHNFRTTCSSLVQIQMNLATILLKTNNFST